MSAGAAGGGVPLSRLAEHAGGEVLGDGGLAITGVSSLAEAGPGDLSYVESDRFAEAARSSRASALFVARPLDGVACAQVVVAEPRYALALVTERYFVPARAAKGVDPRAAVGDDVEIGADPSIWAFATVADGARLGARVTLYPGVFIGPGAVVGDDCVLYPHVSVREGSVIGDRVRIHDGTVIGSDGFGYVQHGGRHQKVPQIGGVTIEDDVEIGANVTVDRGTFGHTRIRRGAKIDNLVQVAHNVVIGEHAIVVAQVGISGSTAVGDGVVIGGQAGIAGHIQIGAGAMLAARTGVNRSLPGGRVYSGVPAMPHEQSMMAYAVIPRLPELRRQVRELERRLRELEEGRG